MSCVACAYQQIQGAYPPVQESGLDKQNEQQLAAVIAEAPFGVAPGTNTPINVNQYADAMNKLNASARATDLRWPFWAGLGLGTLGVVILALKRRH